MKLSGTATEKKVGWGGRGEKTLTEVPIEIRK
jgi:hypothetical protein